MRLKYRILDIEFLKVGLLGLIHEVAVPWIPSRRKDALGDKNTHDLFPNSQLSRHTFLEHKVVDKIYVAIRYINSKENFTLEALNGQRDFLRRWKRVWGSRTYSESLYYALKLFAPVIEAEFSR